MNYFDNYIKLQWIITNTIENIDLMQFKQIFIEKRWFL
jgi:hypothetical protein